MEERGEFVADVLVVAILVVIAFLAFLNNYLWLAGILGIAVVVVLLIQFGREAARGKIIREVIREESREEILPGKGGWPSWETVKGILSDAGEASGLVAKNVLALDELLKEQIGGWVKHKWKALGLKEEEKKAPWEIGSEELEEYGFKIKRAKLDTWLKQYEKLDELSKDKVMYEIKKSYGEYIKKQIEDAIKKAKKKK